MRTRKYAECRRHLLVTRSMKSFRHDVYQHHRSLTVLELDLAALDLITDVMILDVNVLCAAVVGQGSSSS